MRRMRWCSAAIVALAAMGLSGCFDLTQTVGIGRDGSGRYVMAIAAQGIVGEGLKTADIVDTTHNRATLSTAIVADRVTRTARIDFKSLSDVALSDETMGLHVTGRDFFGLGAAHVAFRDTFMVDKARRQQAMDANGVGEQIARAVLGDHAYVFSVTVPGSIERIAPVRVGGQEYRPEVTGDFWHGHTVTWHLPLYALADSRAIEFEVDFVALGVFHDAQTRLVAKT